jgi:hypothetical protein
MTACPAPRHDATGYQRYGCRCDEGRRAQRRYCKRLQLAKRRGQPPKVDNTATIRRIQALAWMGWSERELERRARIGLGTVDTVKRRKSHLVCRTTADAIAAVYDRLWDVDGGNRQSKAYARRAGWAPPAAWDDDTIGDPAARPAHGARVAWRDDPTIDDTAVDRFLTGDRSIRPTPPERREAIRRLRAEGVPEKQIRERVHVSWGQYRRQVDLLEQRGAA